VLPPREPGLAIKLHQRNVPEGPIELVLLAAPLLVQMIVAWVATKKVGQLGWAHGLFAAFLTATMSIIPLWGFLIVEVGRQGFYWTLAMLIFNLGGLLALVVSVVAAVNKPRI
jgi:hypothetical protein